MECVDLVPSLLGAIQAQYQRIGRHITNLATVAEHRYDDTPLYTHLSDQLEVEQARVRALVTELYLLPGGTQYRAQIAALANETFSRAISGVVA
jgi:hypothetical protein